MNLTAIVVAGGAGRRFGGAKQFRAVGGRPMVEWSLRLFEISAEVARTVLVVPEADVAEASTLRDRYPKLSAVVAGGSERRESVAGGIAALGRDATHVLVHDAARPLATAALVARVVEALRAWDAVVPAVATADTLKRVGADRVVTETLDRAEIVRAQTPQGFRRTLLERAHVEVRREAATDDASMVEALGEPVHVVEGESDNFKVTTPADLERADLLLGGRGAAGVRLRVGHGYDVHRLVEGRRLILGGVEIPHERGLLGHSDADVLLHAIGDAVLGAAGARDLGVHFPDTDSRWAGADSGDLLRRVREIAAERGWRPENVDATIVAQRPKLAPHVPRMIANIAACLGVAPDQVNVKATTTEALGFAGREEGIAAHAVCTVTALEPRP